MFRLIRIIPMLFILFSTILYSSASIQSINKEIDYFSKTSADNLYNLNDVSMQDDIKILFKNDAIKAVIIKDALSGDTFVKAYKNGSKVVINKDFTPDIKKLSKQEKPIKYDGDVIGKAIFYYVDQNRAELIGLSKSEEAWLQKHPVLKVGNEYDYPPWDFNKDSQPIGYSIDYMNLLASKLGVKIEYTTDKWNNLLEKLTHKQLDIVHTMFKNSRRKDILYSEPYKKVINAIYVNEDNKDIKSLDDLNGKRVSIPKGDSTTLSLKTLFPGIHLIEAKGYVEAVKDVAFKKSDATILELGVANYLIDQYSIPNIKIVGEVDFPNTEVDYSYHIGVRDDYQILVSILNKAMNSLSEDELNKLDKKWELKGSSKKREKKIELTQSEKDWLSKHKTIKFAGDPNWLPIEGFDDKHNYIGIVSDFLKIIEKRTGIKFDIVQTINFDESADLARKSKIDVISELEESDLRKQLTFTNSYISNPIVIVMNSKENYVEDLNDIKTKKIAAIEGYGYVPKLLQEYPDISFTYVHSIQEGLNAVSNSKVDAFVCTSILGGHTIPKMGLTNIKIVGKTKVTTELGFGVRRDYAPLVSILNKALASITKEEHDAILNKWIRVKFEQETDWKLIMEIVGVAFLILMFIFYNNRKLKQLVNDKTAELQSLLRSFDKNVIASSTDTQGYITYVSDAFCEISGFSRKELIGKTHKLVKHPDMPKEVFVDMWASIKTNQIWKGEVKNRKKGGGYFWADTVITPEHDAEGKLIGYSAIRHDITAKKEVEELSAEQAKQMKEIERSNRLLSGRENRMVELKKEINECKIKVGDEDLYTIVDVDQNKEQPDIAEAESQDTDLETLLNIKQLQFLMENFYNIMHIPLAIIDLEGKVLVQSKWQRACTDFHRVNPESCKRCIESDVELASNLKEGQRFTSYRCKNGLIDCASPIIVNGKHVANFFIGQFLTDEPDMEFFSDQAKHFGYDEKDYLDAIRDIPVVKEDMLPFILSFLVGITDVVTSISIEKLKAQKSESINEAHAIEMKEGQIAAMNLAEDAEKARLEIENYKNNLEILVEERTKELKEQQQQFESMVSNTPGVIYRVNSNTGAVEYVSEQMSVLTGYPVSYFDNADKFNKIIHKDDLAILQESNQEIKDKNIAATVEYRVIHKDGSIKWVRNQRNIIKSEDGTIWRDGTLFDITESKKVQDEIEQNRLFLNTLLDSQDQIILTTDGVKLNSINRAFSEFYTLSMEEFSSRYACICDTFDTDAAEGFLQKTMGGIAWIEYILTHPDQTHKAQITWEGKTSIFSVTAARLPIKNETLMSAVFTDITVLEEQRASLEELHEKISDSIEYASLIQHALVPKDELFEEFFEDHFTIWRPRDVVGGDIYLLEKIGEDEVVCMVIDCTGHGVPGAFVTMLVKAIERQILNNVKIKDEYISPAKILSIFNGSIKHLLQQESDESISNAGFDAGIIYYNKKDKLLRYAGAEIPLYIVQNNELEMIKADRQSIGYKKSDSNYEFTDHTINVESSMRIYMTTDGYIDQNGGEKGFPFGKKRFKEILKSNFELSLEEQKRVFIEKLSEYQKDNEPNDDITVVGLKM